MGQGGVTIKDIAKVVGKSPAAVSKALRGHQDIAPETRRMIQQMAQEMGYKANVAARRLQKQRTETLGLVLPVLSARQADPLLTELLSGIADCATTHGFDLLVSTCAPGPQEENIYRRLADQGRVDGFIIVQPRRDDWRIDFLDQQKTPYTTIGNTNSASTLSSVWVDINSGVKQIIAHLIQQGRQNIALILPPPGLLLAEAYLQAFKAAIALHPKIAGQLSIETRDLSQKEGQRATLALLDGADMPDAIIAGHDLVALGAMAAAQGQGFEIGSDIAMVGFGDILLAEYSQPPLTTLHQPTYNMGQQACQMLLKIIAGQTLPPPSIVIEPWLVIRQSSGLDLWV
ncbi:MAG TPA: LacI family transcriptional regulator [Chloroflexi bacterium]|nr:LacI family transcriptional regulator [Chloroflexota bacterium]